MAKRPKFDWPQFLKGLRKFAQDVADGEDVVEALHGHKCGPKCWHYEGASPKRKRELEELARKRAAPKK